MAISGDRSLLHNSAVLYLPSVMTGRHNDQLPAVPLGRGGGRGWTGRILDYLGKPNRSMCSLYLSLMDKAGVRLKDSAIRSSRSRKSEAAPEGRPPLTPPRRRGRSR
jgi:hypothetical protein